MVSVFSPAFISFHFTVQAPGLAGGGSEGLGEDVTAEVVGCMSECGVVFG